MKCELVNSIHYFRIVFKLTKDNVEVEKRKKGMSYAHAKL